MAARNHGMPLEALRHDVTPAGLHYLLIHYDIPEVDAETFELEVQGAVHRPLSLALPDLKARSRITLPVTLECAGNGRALIEPRPISQPWLTEAVGTARWTGVPLRPILEEARIEDGAVDVLFTGMDRGIEDGVEQSYERSLPLGEAMRDDVLLAYEMNGQRLLPQHGFPLRLVAPGWYGMAHVKWLKRITVLSEPYTGYQQAKRYRLRQSEDEPGEPLTRMQPRALMIPPGIPEFFTRSRVLDAGPVELRGRAWSGWAEIQRVEVSVDGGGAWQDVELEPASTPHVWQSWTYRWDAQPGTYELCCRAADRAGNTQPSDPQWNLMGYGNNAVQRIPVEVRPRS